MFVTCEAYNRALVARSIRSTEVPLIFHTLAIFTHFVLLLLSISFSLCFRSKKKHSILLTRTRFALAFAHLLHLFCFDSIILARKYRQKENPRYYVLPPSQRKSNTIWILNVYVCQDRISTQPLFICETMKPLFTSSLYPFSIIYYILRFVFC